jgi:hypothetical protein
MPMQDQSVVRKQLRVSEGTDKECFPSKEAVPEQVNHEAHRKKRPREQFILALLRALSAWPS